MFEKKKNNANNLKLTVDKAKYSSSLQGETEPGFVVHESGKLKSSSLLGAMQPSYNFDQEEDKKVREGIM